MVYLGQSVRRFEDPRLVTGQGAYVDDIELPSMLHVAVLRSPHAHARIRSLDVTAARSLPGVAAVFTAEELSQPESAPTRGSSTTWRRRSTRCWPRGRCAT